VIPGLHRTAGGPIANKAASESESESEFS
jgi:hypothetical protein